MYERLQKYLADSGICSRRKAEEYIASGRVKVNADIITEMGTKVDTEKDIVLVDDKLVKPIEKKVYILLNKPEQVITSAKDQFGRLSVMDFVKDIKERVVPVGRLDYDTSGLLLMTNDGDLVYKLTHPKHNINKVYEALIKGTPTISEIQCFERGLKIEDYVTSPAKLVIAEKTREGTIVTITIHEGKNRQVRKMCDAIGHPVLKLKRVSIANICLGNLQTGEYRNLTKEEINLLKEKIV